MLLEVGKIFKPGITRYQEGVKFDITDEGFNLFIYYADPTAEEVSDITKGKFKFGYYREKNVILMLFRFGNQNWMDAPYSIHLSKSLEELKQVENEKGYALNIYLVNANNGILKGIRLIGLSTQISNNLYDAITEQRELSYSDYELNLNAIYRKYSTKMLVSMARLM